MFNVGGGEIVVILVIALLLLGPEKLPDAARKVGKFMAEIRRVTSGFQEEVRSAMDIGNSTPPDAALDRTSDGPRLIAPIDPVVPTTPLAPPAQFVGDLSAPLADSASINDGDDPAT